MSKEADLPEPDRMDGVPHPRDCPQLFGHTAAEEEFLEAFAAGRLHHAWMLTGPRGIGKASLAWRMARFLLATPDPAEGDGLFGAPPAPNTLDIDPDHPIARRLRAGSEQTHFVLRRGPNATGSALSAVIRVDQVRKLKEFFHMSAAEGGRRTVIVDAADELAPEAANAVLKMLEEPPARATLFLTCHQPSRLLPTIRSRCRTLRCSSLGAQDLSAALSGAGISPEPGKETALSILSEGSVGLATQLIANGGLETYANLVALFKQAPGMDRSAILDLSNRLSARGAEDRFARALDLLDLLLARLARTGVAGPPSAEAAPGEAETLSRLCPGPHQARAWAELAQALSERIRRGAAVNLDPAALLTDTLLTLDAEARRLAPAPA